MSLTPVARFARWFSVDRGMTCENCSARMEVRGRFCDDDCASAFAERSAF